MSTLNTRIIVIVIVLNNTGIDPVRRKDDLGGRGSSLWHDAYRVQRDWRVRSTVSTAISCYHSITPGQWLLSATRALIHPRTLVVYTLVATARPLPLIFFSFFFFFFFLFFFWLKFPSYSRRRFFSLFKMTETSRRKLRETSEEDFDSDI